MTLAEIASQYSSMHGVCIDSRQLQPGQVFIALRGEQFDGHDFIEAAVQKGAAAILSERSFPHLSIPQCVVSDTQQALTEWAILHRQAQTCAVIALTGSNGKTTVKEMIAAILPQPSFATPGNLNNHIGVPLSVLRLKPEHQYAVFELGASHIGEIAHTAAIVKPQVTLINNIAPAHIEGFGSIDGVAQAKGEIHAALSENGVAVINADDAYADFWNPVLRDKQVLHFSQQQNTPIHARAITFNAEGQAEFILVTPKGEISIKLNVPGQHNISNALAAAACAYALEIDLDQIATGLNQFSGVAGRMSFKHGKNQALIIDDTYNANLRSMLTALDVLAMRKGRRIFVMGDMGELGDWSEEHHQKVGAAARAQGIDLMMTCGKHSAAASAAFGQKAKHYVTQQALTEDLLPYLGADTTVLVKGSRSSTMERIVQQLVE
jgi:UDP-N-acetylmuramoyl-tripeptide--D-alanyl-D-alanine ligase